MAAELSGLGGRALRLPRILPEPATIGVCAPSGRVDEATALPGFFIQTTLFEKYPNWTTSVKPSPSTSIGRSLKLSTY